MDGKKRNLLQLTGGEKLKPNMRRAFGLLTYPRIGRSNAPISNLNFNRRGVESDTDFQFYSAELDPAPDKDYEGEVSPITLKRAPSPPLRTPYTAIPFYVYFVLFSDRWPIPSRAILPTTRPPRMITGQDFLPFSPFL